MEKYIKVCQEDSDFEIVFERWGMRFNFHAEHEKVFFKNVCKIYYYRI